MVTSAPTTWSRGGWAALVLAGVALVSAPGCAEPPALEVTAVEPAWGPVAGGTRLAIHGRGFARLPAGVRVLFGDRPAPLVATVDDDTLDVLTPPALSPGPVELTVLVGEEVVRRGDGFRYSRPPTIDTVTPADVHHALFTRMTVTGTGFLDEDAGPPTVLLDGIPLEGAHALSDTELELIAPSGRPLRMPTLEVVNRRGLARQARAFRYLPSDRPGLLLFGEADNFATFVDPVAQVTVPIPWGGNVQVRLTAVVRDDHGDYWGLDRTRRLGRLDLSEQRLDAPGLLGRWSPAIARVGDTTIMIDRSQRRLARLELVSGTFVTLPATGLPCCGSYGLASDGTTLYLVARDGTAVTLRVVEPTTGELGPALAVDGPPGLHVEDMRFFAGTLYAVTRDQTMVTIDPATGAVTKLPVTTPRVHALEVFEP